LVEIERSREKELRELKKKFDLERLSTAPVAIHNINPKIIGKEIQEFKNDLNKILMPVKELLDKSGKA
jgi:hypothetical protein